jgi:hypothetical protein
LLTELEEKEATKAPVAEESDYIRLCKSLPQDKLTAYLISIKYIKDGEGYDKVSKKRQATIMARADGFKANVEAVQVKGVAK